MVLAHGITTKHNTAKAYVIIVLCLFFVFCTGGCEDQQPEHDTKQQAPVQDSPPDDKVVIHLYFADRENAYLMAEDKLVSRPVDTNQLGALIVNAHPHGRVLPLDGWVRVQSDGRDNQVWPTCLDRDNQLERVICLVTFLNLFARVHPRFRGVG